MFFVVFDDGEKITEKDVGNWDNVPRNKRIAEAGLIVSPHSPPVKIPKSEQYYIARLGSASLDGIQRHLGYVMVGKKNGTCVRITVRYEGITFDIPDPAQLDIRTDTWREGINGG